MNESKITPIDPGLLKEIRASVNFASKHGDTELVKQTAASLSNYQPSTVSTMGGIGYMQSGFIGSELLPEIIASPDGQEQASYPVFGKEFFFSADDVIAVSGAVKRSDLALTWTSETLDVHGKQAYVDAREQRAASAVGIDIAAQKVDLVRTQVQTRKEALAAALLTATASYASASYYATLSGTTQWSHASSTPLTVIEAKKEVIRAAIGVRPNALWLSPTAYAALRFNPQIIGIVNGGATKQNPAAPVGADVLAAIFGLNVFVGDAIQTTTVGGASSDIWSDAAGLLYVGGNDLMSPKFGATFTAGGYPKVDSYRDETQGAEGSDVYRYSEAYKHIVTLNTAGFLWLDVTA